MPNITLQSVNNYILKNVSLTVYHGEFMVLLGHNGAGKSTLLNVIAGLIHYEGSVLFDDKPVDSVRTEKRSVGYLFQDLALFPHMNVRANVRYGISHQSGAKGAKGFDRVKVLLEMVNIGHLSDRYPKDLSGGEKQRVALARAIAAGPKVLLMDEPLSGLDLVSAKHLRSEFRHLQRKLGTTTIFVTHSLDEASELADRVAIIDRGEILQVGTPNEIIFSPVDQRIRHFIGEPNIFSCSSSRAIENGLAVAKCGEMEIVTPYEGSPIRKVAISPEHVYVSLEVPAGPHINRFQGVVKEINAYPSVLRLHISVCEKSVLAELPRKIFDGMGLKKGSQVHIIFKLRWLQILS